MIPMLNQGREGITAMMEEAKRLGLVMSADTQLHLRSLHHEI
jgi:hypothetical protein